MALRMRKSFKITKGVRLNVGKTGLGISFGTKGLRHSIHSSGRRTSTIGIPGTGVSYSKTSRGPNKRKSASKASIVRDQFQQQKQLQKQNSIQQNTNLVNQYNHYIETIKGIHRECDQFIDWRRINDKPAPYNPPEFGPLKSRAIVEFEHFTPNFIERIFKSLGEKRRIKLMENIPQAELHDIKKYEDWQRINLLSEKVLQGDIDAYFQVIDEMRPLDDLLGFGSDFEIGAYDGSTLEVEFKVKSDKVVPDYVISLTQTGKLSKKNMTKTQFYELVQDSICSCSIRIARDLMSLLPIDKVVVHAVDNLLNTATGFNEEKTILSVAFDREGLSSLNIEYIDPSDALQNFQFNMKYMKTSGMKPVERIQVY